MSQSVKSQFSLIFLLFSFGSIIKGVFLVFVLVFR